MILVGKFAPRTQVSSRMRRSEGDRAAGPSKNTEWEFRLILCFGSGTCLTDLEIAPFCAHLEVPRSPFFGSGRILEFGRIVGPEALERRNCASVTQFSVVLF